MKRPIALITALIAWTAFLVQAVIFVQRGLAHGDSLAHALLDYLSYFTVATNLFVALVVGLPLFAAGTGLAQWVAKPFPSAVAAASIIHVGITYHFLLAGIHEPTGIEFYTDIGMRYVVPALFTVYWFVVSSKQGLTFSDLPAFTIYPLAYFGFVLARGKVVGEYPHFFISVKDLGMRGALVNEAWILLFYSIIVVVLLAVTTKQRRITA